jgi:hypothetical protein
MNKKAAKVFVKEIGLFQADDKGPEGGGDARGLAKQFLERTHKTTQQRNVRGKFRCAIPGTQSVDYARQAIRHISCRHEPQRVSFPGRRLAHRLA